MATDVLRTLQTDVLELPAVPSSTKSSFFNAYVLEQLVKVYEAKESQSSGAVHSLLSCLVSQGPQQQQQQQASGSGSGSSGEVQGSTASNTRARQHQSTLLRLLCQLKCNEDVQQQQLALSIISAYPSLARPYLQQIPFSFEPRPSFRWVANMSFLRKLHTLSTWLPTKDATNLLLSSTTSSSSSSTSPRITPSFLLEWMFPPSLNKHTLSHGLQHTSHLVIHTTLTVLNTAFTRYGDLVNAACQDHPVSARRVFAEKLRLLVPNPQVVFGLRAKLDPLLLAVQAAKEAKKKSGDESKGMGKGKQMWDTMYAQLLSVLTAYQTYLPEAVAESHLDVWKLVAPGTSVHTLAPICQYRMLQLLQVRVCVYMYTCVYIRVCAQLSGLLLGS
jgi:hypothetical protein